METKDTTDIEFRRRVRAALANYMHSEGCSCCQNVEGHKEDEEVLAKLLKVKKYSDGSGYDFRRYGDKYPKL
jgi:hypothetical protein